MAMPSPRALQHISCILTKLTGQDGSEKNLTVTGYISTQEG